MRNALLSLALLGALATPAAAEDICYDVWVATPVQPTVKSTVCVPFNP